jgi:hypothetical protein
MPVGGKHASIKALREGDFLGSRRLWSFVFARDRDPIFADRLGSIKNETKVA